MPYRYRDLIVTVVPRLRDPGLVASGGPGCGGCSDAGSASVGSCTSECGAGNCFGSDFRCGDSGEMLELGPYRWIDPPLQMELRQLLVYALARSEVQVPQARPLGELEAQMQPRSVTEVREIETHLVSALREVRKQKDRLHPPSLVTRILRLLGLRR